jgi:hypothetical protein
MPRPPHGSAHAADIADAGVTELAAQVKVPYLEYATVAGTLIAESSDSRRGNSAIMVFYSPSFGHFRGLVTQRQDAAVFAVLLLSTIGFKITNSGMYEALCSVIRGATYTSAS